MSKSIGLQILSVDQRLGICALVNSQSMGFSIKGDGWSSIREQGFINTHKPHGTYHPDSLVH